MDIKKPCEDSGIADSTKREKVSVKFSIGIYGIRFSTNRSAGKMAMKKLKDILPALEVKSPLIKPNTYILMRS